MRIDLSPSRRMNQQPAFWQTFETSPETFTTFPFRASACWWTWATVKVGAAERTRPRRTTPSASTSFRWADERPAEE